MRKIEQCAVVVIRKLFLTALAFLALAFFLPTSPAVAQSSATFYVDPFGSGTQCTLANRCALPTAMSSCYAQAVEICNINFNDGIYVDPGVNIYYYRAVQLVGNCSAPQNVILRATIPNTALIWIQDHAIGIVQCLTLEAHVNGVSGIMGRQHIIADWGNIIFSIMPLGIHVFLNEFSIGSCVGPVWLRGGAMAHVAVSNSSKANIGCQVNAASSISFSSGFATANAFSIIDAGVATFTGGPVSGAGCTSQQSIVSPPPQGFPGQPSRC
jgi:hypothetical protein